MSQQAPGWYPDPSGSGSQAYWDGRQWSSGPPAPVGYAQPTPTTSGLAVAALICAFLVPFVLPLILGYAAKGEIKRSNGMKTGSGMATAALVLGWIFTGMVALFLFAYIAALGGAGR